MHDDRTTANRWYGARCVFRWRSPKPEQGGASYEERVVVLRAVSFDHAIARAEEDAKTYAAETDADYLDFVTVYELPEETLGDATEVFSLLRDSDLAPQEYLDRHFDTGRERCTDQ